jgi:hypothetical protein
MGSYDPHQQLRRLDTIETQMARHERTTRMILILMILLAAVASGVLLTSIS